MDGMATPVVKPQAAEEHKSAVAVVVVAPGPGWLSMAAEHAQDCSDAIYRWWSQIEATQVKYTHLWNTFTRRYGHESRRRHSQRLQKQYPNGVPVVVLYQPSIWAALQPPVLPTAATAARGLLPVSGYVVRTVHKEATLSQLVASIRRTYKAALRPEYGIVLTLDHTLPPMTARVGHLWNESQAAQAELARRFNDACPATCHYHLDGADGFLYLQLQGEHVFG